MSLCECSKPSTSAAKKLCRAPLLHADSVSQNEDAIAREEVREAVRDAEYGCVSEVFPDDAPESGLGERILCRSRLVEAHDAAAQQEGACDREELPLANGPVPPTRLELRVKAGPEESCLARGRLRSSHRPILRVGSLPAPLLGVQLQQTARPEDALKLGVTVFPVRV